MKAHFKRNHRLAWAFEICSGLSIDDPVAWMDAVDPVVLDRWIAYKIFKREVDGGSSDDSPESALEKLRKM